MASNKEMGELLTSVSPRVGELSIYGILESGRVLRVDVGDWRLGEGEVRGTILLFLHRHHPVTYLFIVVCTKDGSADITNREELSLCLHFALFLVPYVQLQEFFLVCSSFSLSYRWSVNFCTTSP